MSKRKTKTKAQIKARRTKFQHTKKAQTNQIKNMQNAYYGQMLERQEIMKRANIVEQIYKARPEIGTIIEGKLQLDETIVVEKENILYWVKDNNPVLAGLESFENYSKYSKDFVNQVLEIVQQHSVSEQTTDIDLDGFELVEDESINLENVESKRS